MYHSFLIHSSADGHLGLLREKMTFLEFLGKKKLGNVNSACTCVVLFLNGGETTLNGLCYYFYLSTFLFL